MLVLLSAVAVLWAQDADADRAAATFKQGVAQYKAMDFKAAKSTFLKVDRDRLSDADKTALDDYLAKVDLAISRQAAAMSAYDAAVKALRANELLQARQQFEIAASSEYLPEPVRRDARAQLALVAQKIAAAEAAAPAEQPVEQPPVEAIKVQLPPVTTAPAEPQAPPATAPAEEVAALTPEPTTMPAYLPPDLTAGSAAVPATTAPAPAEQPGVILSEVLQRRAKANQLLEQGKKALAEGNADQAARCFQQALDLVPQMQEATDLLQQAQALTGEQGGALSVLEQKRRIRRQQADVEFDKDLRRSSEQLLSASSAADFDAAAESARLAENMIQANKNLYAEGEYRERLTEVETRLSGIAQRRDDWDRAQVQQQLAEMAKAEAQRAQRAKEQLDQQISTLMENAKTLRAEQKYSEALEVVQQILRLQPTNPWAADQAEVLQQFIVVKGQQGILSDTRGEQTQTYLDIEESAIPWHKAITFPYDWLEKSQWLQGRGLQAVYGSKEDQRIRRLLKEGTQEEVTIDEQPLSSVIDLFKQITGINVWPNWKFLESVGYTRDATIVSSVHLVKVSNEKALQVMLEDASGPNAGGPNELAYVVDGGVVTISTRADLARKVTQVVYDVRDIVRVMALARRDFVSFQTTGGSLGAVTTTAGQATGTAEAQTTYTGTAGIGTSVTGVGTTGTTGEISQTAINSIINLITTTVDPPSWEQLGGVGRIYYYNDQLVVTQTAANHAAIADLVNQLREAKEIEVAIEARFISVNTGYLENIGVDLDFYFNIGSRLGSGTRTDPFTGATVPTTTGTSGWGTDPKGSNNFTPMGLAQGSSSFTESVSTSVGTSIGSLVTTPAMSLQGKFLDDIEVDFLIRATQAHKATRTLTAPRVTLLSGTTARIFVGRQFYYASEVTNTVAGITQYQAQITPTITTAQLSVGTELVIGATVSADLKYVTLTVVPSVTRLLALTTFKSSTDPSTFSQVQLPDVATETLETTVTVPDGGTLVLGGLKSFGEEEREMGVPLLSKIPIINRAFTNRAKVQDEETLLILIKPTIIVPRDEEKRLFP